VERPEDAGEKFPLVFYLAPVAEYGTTVASGFPEGLPRPSATGEGSYAVSSPLRREDGGCIMAAALEKDKPPLGLVVTGEAESWLPALEQIVGPRWVQPYHASGPRELMDLVESGLADAAVLDDETDWAVDVLRLLRMIRRLNAMLPVVVVTGLRDRRWLESALRLEVLSVVVRPLALEELLRQIRRMMLRLDRTLREGPTGG